MRHPKLAPRGEEGSEGGGSGSSGPSRPQPSGATGTSAGHAGPGRAAGRGEGNASRVPALRAHPSGAPFGAGSVRGLPRRATLRPEIRAAMALEEAGELQEAARVFEYAGEHAQAALLRLEHTKTLRDPGERLDVLREGCARNPGTTAEGRTLHLALAETLLDEADHAPDSAKRRALELEAAQALEEADEGARAGEIYEALGLLGRAATAYERSGELSRLELVLEVLDRADQEQQARRAREREIDEAVAEGRRRYAHLLLLEAVHGGARPAVHEGTALALRESGPIPLERRAPPALVTRLQLLESRLVRRDRIELGWNDGRVTAVRGGPRFRIGRAPDADLSLAGARLSRHHVEIAVDPTGDRPRLVAIDLGSRVGTFWQGEALVPGEPMPIETEGELGLGMGTALELHPVDSERNVVGALVRAVGEARWMLFLPGGGPLWLAPGIRVPARLLFDRGYVVLDLASRVAASLHDVALAPGSPIELMIGDRIALHGAPLTIEVLA